jgi:hypothetical protein
MLEVGLEETVWIVRDCCGLFDVPEDARRLRKEET